jgi:hypothetical protein
LISSTWESSRYFSGAVARERNAIGKPVWQGNCFFCLLFAILITAEIMDTSGIDYTKTSLISYMRPFTNVDIKPAEPWK